MSEQELKQELDQSKSAVKLEVSYEGLQAMLGAVVPLLYDFMSPTALREVTFRSPGKDASKKQ